jgi:tetratricopeptide (TPR) repeat protein
MVLGSSTCGGTRGIERGCLYKSNGGYQQALELDNNLPEAHATLGLLRCVYEWDWEGAEKAFKAALDLNPGSSKSHYDYSLYLSAVKKSLNSISEARKAVELDPLSGNAHFTLGVSLYALGHLDQALGELRYAREMIPRHLPSIIVLVSTYVGKGMLDEAIEETKKGLELFPKDPQLLARMGSIYVQRDEKEKTRAILEELLERSKKEHVPASVMAQFCAWLGKMNRTFEYLEEGYEKRDLSLYAIKLWPLSNVLRTDPRFIAFLKKMGLNE